MLLVSASLHELPRRQGVPEPEYRDEDDVEKLLFVLCEVRELISDSLGRRRRLRRLALFWPYEGGRGRVTTITSPTLAPLFTSTSSAALVHCCCCCLLALLNWSLPPPLFPLPITVATAELALLMTWLLFTLGLTPLRLETPLGALLLQLLLIVLLLLP